MCALGTLCTLSIRCTQAQSTIRLKCIILMIWHGECIRLCISGCALCTRSGGNTSPYSLLQNLTSQHQHHHRFRSRMAALNAFWSLHFDSTLLALGTAHAFMDADTATAHNTRCHLLAKYHPSYRMRCIHTYCECGWTNSKTLCPNTGKIFHYHNHKLNGK